LQGYPNLEHHSEEEEGTQRRSARIRTRQRDDGIDDEEDAIHSEREEESREVEANQFGTMEPMTTRSRRVVKKEVQVCYLIVFDNYISENNMAQY
jgi:hypothetical protein